MSESYEGAKETYARMQARRPCAARPARAAAHAALRCRRAPPAGTARAVAGNKIIITRRAHEAARGATHSGSACGSVYPARHGWQERVKTYQSRVKTILDNCEGFFNTFKTIKQYIPDDINLQVPSIPRYPTRHGIPRGTVSHAAR
jgi:hypothetical protein